MMRFHVIMGDIYSNSQIYLDKSKNLLQIIIYGDTFNKCAQTTLDGSFLLIYSLSKKYIDLTELNKIYSEIVDIRQKLKEVENNFPKLYSFEV